jgi:lipoyl(octanoyl) transferase
MEILKNLRLPKEFCAVSPLLLPAISPEARGMRPFIDCLRLLDQRATPGEAAWNMAIDEALLMGGAGPILRVYRWDRPSISFGYFLPWAAAASVAGGNPVVRRWTGGGIAEHGSDWTWSLIVPRDSRLARLRPRESYVAIHDELGRALRLVGVPAEHVDGAAPAPAGGICFESPAPGDLLLAGKKIAGAGQRRCRAGLLHQGSLSGVHVPDGFAAQFAACLAGRVRAFRLDRVPTEEARELVRIRYGTGEWLKKR